MKDDERRRFARMIRESSRKIGEAIELCRALPEGEREVWLLRCGRVLAEFHQQFILPLQAEDPGMFPELDP